MTAPKKSAEEVRAEARYEWDGKTSLEKADTHLDRLLHKLHLVPELAVQVVVAVYLRELVRPTPPPPHPQRV